MTLLDNYPSDLPGVFGNWGVGPGVQDDGVSFAAGPSHGPATSLWRLDLQDDPQAARQQIKNAENELSQAQAALANVPNRIDALVVRLGDGQKVSFDVGPASQEGDVIFRDPEVELLSWIEGLDTDRLSFGLSGLNPREMVEASGQFRQAIAGLSRALLHLAWVETHIGSQLLARTVVDWSGDLDTAWGRDIGGEGFEYHRRSLALALASRITLLNTLSITTRAAVKLSVLIATPGAQLLALPAAWKYVNQILSQAKIYSEIREKSKENETWQTNSKTH